MTRILRRALVGLLLLVAIVTLSAFWPNIPDVDKQSPLAAVVPPPSHIEWTQYPVGGLFLARYPEGDSTHTRVELLPIPAGSILVVPHTVPGEDPDSTRSGS